MCKHCELLNNIIINAVFLITIKENECDNEKYIIHTYCIKLISSWKLIDKYSTNYIEHLV